MAQSTEPFPARFQLSSRVPANGGDRTAGSVYVEGGVIPGILGDPFGASRFDGDLDLGLAAYTIFEVGGTSLGVDLDQTTAQRLGVGGTLQVVRANGYPPQPGDVYPVLDFVTATGSFTSIVLDPALISARTDTTDFLNNGTVFIAAPCSVDLNGGGIIDLGDVQAFIADFLAGC